MTKRESARLVAKAALEAHPQVTIQILQGHQFDAKVRHRDDLGQTWQVCQTWVDGREAPAAAAAGRECLRLLLLHGHFAEALQVLWGFDVGSVGLRFDMF